TKVGVSDHPQNRQGARPDVRRRCCCGRIRSSSKSCARRAPTQDENGSILSAPSTDERRHYLVPGVRIEYDVGAVRYPALLPLSTTSRIVINAAPSVGGLCATEEAGDGSTA